MNWKYEAIEKLRDYEAKKLALSTLPEEIRRLELDAQRIRSATGDGTPVKGGGSTREDILLSNIVHREELERSLEMARKWVALVDAGLEILSEEDRLVLLRFYMHPERATWRGCVENWDLKSLQFTIAAKKPCAASRSPYMAGAKYKIRKKTGRLMRMDVLY